MNIVDTSSISLTSLRWREYSVTVGVAAAAIVRATYGIDECDGESVSTNVWRFNGSGAHNFQVDDLVVLSGESMPPVWRNSAWRVVTVSEADSFDLYIPFGRYTSGAISSWAATLRSHAQTAVVRAGSGNTHPVSIGTHPTAPGWKDLIPGEEYVIPAAPHGAKFDLADWYAVSEAAAQTLKVLYI